MNEEIIQLTSMIVSAYVANNPVAAADLPWLISTLANALDSLGRPIKEPATALVPAVPIRKSVTRDHIFSLEDGKPYRTLKRHLGRLGMTPDAYRAKWGLPSDYPMVAASYREKRSTLAKAFRLGVRLERPDEVQ